MTKIVIEHVLSRLHEYDGLQAEARELADLLRGELM
jgi:hypothetical protein